MGVKGVSGSTAAAGRPTAAAGVGSRPTSPTSIPALIQSFVGLAKLEAKLSKKHKPKTPNAKAVADLTADGWQAEKVEQRLPIPGKFITRDLFECIDIIAIKKGLKIFAVQATSHNGGNVAKRMAKSLEVARVWVKAGGVFEIWGYHKKGKRVVRMTDNGEWEEVA